MLPPSVPPSHFNYHWRGTLATTRIYLVFLFSCRPYGDIFNSFVKPISFFALYYISLIKDEFTHYNETAVTLSSLQRPFTSPLKWNRAFQAWNHFDNLGLLFQNKISLKGDLFSSHTLRYRTVKVVVVLDLLDVHLYASGCRGLYN